MHLIKRSHLQLTSEKNNTLKVQSHPKILTYSTWYVEKQSLRATKVFSLLLLFIMNGKNMSKRSMWHEKMRQQDVKGMSAREIVVC